MSDMFEIGVSLALSDGVADEMARLRLDMARWQAGLRTGGVPVGALNQAAARALSVSGAAVPERVVVPKAVSVPVPPPPPPLAAQGPGPAASLVPQAATLRPVDGGEAGPAAERASERLVAVVQAWPPHPVAPGAGREAPPIPQAPLESRAVASPHAATLGMLGENARQPAAVPMAPFMPAARIGASLGVPQDMPRWTQPDAQVPPTGQAPEMVRAPATPVWTMSASLDAAPGAPSQPVAPVASTIIQQAVAGQGARGAATVQQQGGVGRATQLRPDQAQGGAVPEPPPTPQGGQAQMGGDVFLDGALVGKWMSRFLGREAMRAPAGPTGFDPRRGRLMPGATVGG